MRVVSATLAMLAISSAAQANWQVTCGRPFPYLEFQACTATACGTTEREAVARCRIECFESGIQTSTETACAVPSTVLTQLQREWEHWDYWRRAEYLSRHPRATEALLPRQYYRFARMRAHENRRRLKEQGIDP